MIGQDLKRFCITIFLVFSNFKDVRGGSGENWADLVIPISRNKPLNDGLWFEVVNATDVQRKEVVVPRNVYKAVLEVYVSFHENDEFWPTNAVNEYICDYLGPHVGPTCVNRSYCITLTVTTSFVCYINILESSLPNIENFSKFVTYLCNFPKKKFIVWFTISLLAWR